MTRGDTPPLTPELMLQAYCAGIFPMADSRDATELHWIDPQQRGIFPMDGFHISRSLARRIRQRPFRVTFDRDFAGVMAGCADRPETWINGTIFDLFQVLHRNGFAHSVELWEDDALVGGVYGVSVGAAWFGESMFSRRTDASKIALAYLMHRLRTGGFTLFDTQFLTPHLASLGAVEVPRLRYRRMLARSIAQKADFNRAGADAPPPAQVLQRTTQTS